MRLPSGPFCRQKNCNQQQHRERKQRVGSWSRETVHGKVGNLFRPKKRRREGLNLDRGGRIKVVAVHIEPVIETPHREQAEVSKEHKHVDQIGHLPKDHCPERQDNQQADHQRDPGEFAEVAFQQWPHADVVIERVDLSQVVAVWGFAAFQRIRINVQHQPIRVLVRVKAHVPEREEEGWEQYYDRNENQNAALQRQRQLKEGCFLFEKITHVGTTPVLLCISTRRKDEELKSILHPSSFFQIATSAAAQRRLFPFRENHSCWYDSCLTLHFHPPEG